MKVCSYEFPYEEKVSYLKEKDVFESLVLVKMNTEEYGMLEFEVPLYKSYKHVNWKVGEIYYITTEFPRRYVSELKKWLRSEKTGLMQELEKEEEKIRKGFESFPKLSIVSAEKMEEYVDEKNRYFQRFRMELAPFSKYFTVYFEKTRRGKVVLITMRKRKYDGKQLDEFWYPGWRKDFDELMLQFWMDLEEDVLDAETKKTLFVNTFGKVWSKIR